MKQKLVDYRQWRKKALKDPEVKKALAEAEEDPAVEIACQLIRLREQHHLTQAQLARKLRTSQQAIARLESLNYAGYSFKVLERIAEVFHKKLKVQFV
ncbi:MAG: helix-turn-helix transcriptional regulator [Elusimicrobia bacterium]|nr:helix-turn-helix transcriptional regulator [Elusimicrobiota bacterium]